MDSDFRLSLVGAEAIAVLRTPNRCAARALAAAQRDRRPACNEAAHLESAARTILDQDYPQLEIILVDDRSSDGTGALIDLLAREDARVKAIHIDKLPDGWLGKVHALQRGVERAEGEWLLFTDADVHFAPTMLRRAVAYVTHSKPIT